MSALGRGNNGKRIKIGSKMEIYVSYETVIGFWTPETGLKVRHNEWGPTTGGHINAIPGIDKSALMDGEDFKKDFNKVLEDHGLL